MLGNYANQCSTMLHNGGFASPFMSPCANFGNTFGAGTAVFAVLAFLIYAPTLILRAGGICIGILRHVLRVGIRPQQLNRAKAFG